jgi:hypothetical protein
MRDTGRDGYLGPLLLEAPRAVLGGGTLDEVTGPLALGPTLGVDHVGIEGI